MLPNFLLSPQEKEEGQTRRYFPFLKTIRKDFPRSLAWPPLPTFLCTARCHPLLRVGGCLCGRGLDGKGRACPSAEKRWWSEVSKSREGDRWSLPVPPQGNFFVQSKPKVCLAAPHLGSNFQPLWLIIQGDLADNNHVSNYLLMSREDENNWLQRPLCFPEKLSWL